MEPSSKPRSALARFVPNGLHSCRQSRNDSGYCLQNEIGGLYEQECVSDQPGSARTTAETIRTDWQRYVAYASTGNTSIKLEGFLWIKASGKWMSDALHEDILIPLDLAEVKEHVKQKVDPAERYNGASIKTAMHAVLPHRCGARTLREHHRLGGTGGCTSSTGTPT